MPKIKAFSLIELLIASALGFILLLALAKFLWYAIGVYQAQHDYHVLQNEAITAGTVLSSELSQAGDLHCLRLSADMLDNFSTFLPQTQSGIKMIHLGEDALPSVFPRASIPKLLPRSLLIIEENPSGPFVSGAENLQTGYFEAAQGSTIQKDHLVMLTNCQNAWLFQPAYYRKHAEHMWVSLPFHLPPDTSAIKNYQLVHWRITLWFIMKNQQHIYSLYRMHLPDDTAPEEIISDIHDWQAQVHLKNTGWQEAQSALDWRQVDLIRLRLHFQKNKQHFVWPVSIVLSVESKIRKL